MVLPEANANRVVALLTLRDREVPRLIDIQFGAVRGNTVVAEHLLREEIPLIRDWILLVQSVPHALLATTDQVVLDPQHHVRRVARRVDSSTLLPSQA